jgi:hypothetical protein
LSSCSSQVYWLPPPRNRGLFPGLGGFFAEGSTLRVRLLDPSRFRTRTPLACHWPCLRRSRRRTYGHRNSY